MCSISSMQGFQVLEKFKKLIYRMNYQHTVEVSKQRMSSPHWIGTFPPDQLKDVDRWAAHFDRVLHKLRMRQRECPNRQGNALKSMNEGLLWANHSSYFNNADARVPWLSANEVRFSDGHLLEFFQLLNTSSKSRPKKQKRRNASD